MTERDVAGPVGEVGRDGRVVTFYSYKGGTGRTMAVANVAWILASNGYRVLAVDWDLEAPGLTTFFAPFLDGVKAATATGVIDLIADYRRLALEPAERTPRWVQQAARVRTHAIPLQWDGFRNGGSIDLLTAGQLNTDYSATLGSIDWEDFYTRLQGGRFFAALRADMCRSYDYILIDSRTGLSDSAEICTVDMPHELVVCFTLGNQSIDGAASVARLIDSVCGDRGIRILPVPMRVDSGELRKVAEGKAYARSLFAGLPQGLTGEALDRYWSAVEVPYKPFYAFEEILAPFGDEPGLPTTLLSAFERLTAELTGGRVTALDPVGAEVRRRYAEAFHRWSALPQPHPSDVQLTYVPEDRPWSDWIEHVLTRAGFRVRSTDVSVESDDEQEPVKATDPGFRTVAVLSSSYMRSWRARTHWQSVTGTDPQGLRRQLIPVRIGEVHASELFNNRNAVDLTRAEEAEAVSLLLGALGALGAAELPEEPTGGPGPRYPGTRPRIWNARKATAHSPDVRRSWSGCEHSSAAGRPSLRSHRCCWGLGGVPRQVVLFRAVLYQTMTPPPLHIARSAAPSMLARRSETCRT